MGSVQKPKSNSTGRNDNRASGKGSKKNPKPNNYGATGRTVGGYSPAKLEQRALKRKYNNVASSETSG